MAAYCEIPFLLPFFFFFLMLTSALISSVPFRSAAPSAARQPATSKPWSFRGAQRAHRGSASITKVRIELSVSHIIELSPGVPDAQPAHTSLRQATWRRSTTHIIGQTTFALTKSQTALGPREIRMEVRAPTTAMHVDDVSILGLASSIHFHLAGLLYLAETWSGSNAFPDSSYKQFYEVSNVSWQRFYTVSGAASLKIVPFPNQVTCASCRATSSSNAVQTSTFINWGRRYCPAGTRTISALVWNYSRMGRIESALTISLAALAHTKSSRSGKLLS